MKQLLALIIAATFSVTALAADEVAKPETKRVCIDQKDAKTGKTKEVCKTVKVHKKHEGTKVPEGKKK